jgi:hypothetical protein
MHGLKGGLEASFAGSRLDSEASIGRPGSAAVIFSSIPNQRGTIPKRSATRQKSMKVARRALSTSLNRGKHCLAQEAGLFRDVLLHKSIVTEVFVFFQCYVCIAVITHRYDLSAICSSLTLAVRRE